jgi:hypothetical protein
VRTRARRDHDKEVLGSLMNPGAALSNPRPLTVTSPLFSFGNSPLGGMPRLTEHRGAEFHS